MLRKLAAGTSAAFVAAGLTAAPAVASRLPSSSENSCGDMAQTEQDPLDKVTTQGFVFGPLADVPQLLSDRRVCFTTAAVPSDVSAASRRHGSGPPPVGSPPVPTNPGSPESGGPGVPASSEALPPGDSPEPPGSTDITPMLSPPPVSTGPTPASSPAEFVGPAETDFVPAAGPEGRPRSLPQTGRGSRPLAAAGGAHLLAAGLALIAGARRRKRREGPAAPPPEKTAG